MAIYPYIVNHNGKWYPAGADVPADDAPSEKSEKPAAEKVAHTRKGVEKMSVSELRAVAESIGILEYKVLNGSELRKEICKTLKL